MAASGSKKRSWSAVNEVPEGTQNQQTDGQNSQAARSENPGSSEKSTRDIKNPKHAEDCRKSRKKNGEKNDRIAAEREEYREENIRLRALLDQSEKHADKWEAMVNKMTGELREDHRIWRGDVEKGTDSLNKLSAILIAKQQQHFGSAIMERGSTSASTDVVQVNGPSQSLPTDSGAIHLAHSMLRERHAASEARHAQEIIALLENQAREVATINMKHQQELDTLKQEACAREENLRQELQRYQAFNFNADALFE